LESAAENQTKEIMVARQFSILELKQIHAFSIERKIER